MTSIIPSLPDLLQNGTPADATQVMADFYQIQNDVNANAAENGANSSITSLTGLTTPLSIAQGGIGATSFNAATILSTASASPVAGDIPTFTGTGTAVTDSGTLLTSLAPLASPALTGTPTAPTAAPGTNTTQLATTAFVAALSLSGRLLNIQKFTSSGTYTPTAGTNSVVIWAVGGGGGGGGSGSSGASNGGNGGTTSVGSLLSVGGGGGGILSTNNIIGGGGAGGSATTATIKLPGSGGGGGALAAGSIQGQGGIGGTGIFGSGAGNPTSTSGIAGATNTGAGGAGGSSNTAQAAGGGGAGGIGITYAGSISGTYVVTVGTSGTAGTAGSGGWAGGAGGTGMVVIFEYA